MTGHVYYIPHGGGPMPLMGDPRHAAMTAMLRGLEPETAGNAAIVVVTAHWEGQVVEFSGAARPGMLFDYYGFPPETYEYVYPAPGAPDLAARAVDLLATAGIDGRIDNARGYDHGTFVPMMLIRPDADVPVLQMSLLASLDPAAHIAVGRALAPLLADGVTMIGSGLSFHNLRALIQGQPISDGADAAFDDWLNDTLLGDDLDGAARTDALSDWSAAPGARACHPREEHLLPLHVSYGAASGAGLTGESIFRERLMGFMTSGFRWAAA